MPSDPDEAGEDALIRSMTAYQGGDIEGFESLYAALAADLERFFTAAQGPAAARDLVQDTFLEIHRSRRTYLAPRPVRPWIFGLAKNVLRRHRRGAWRRSRHEVAPTAAGPIWFAEPSIRSRAVDAGDVVEALRRIPDARREAWLLHHVYGWSFHEIASRLRIGVDAAKLRSSRAMRSLRGALGIERRRRDSRD